MDSTPNPRQGALLPLPADVPFPDRYLAAIAATGYCIEHTAEGGGTPLRGDGSLALDYLADRA